MKFCFFFSFFVYLHKKCLIFPDDFGKATEIAISRSRNSEMQVEFPIEVPTKDNGTKQNSYMENGKTDSQGVPEKIMEENIKVIDDSNGVIAGELGLKRPRATDNDGGEVQNVCHILRHSELSAFTRFKFYNALKLSLLTFFFVD